MTYKSPLSLRTDPNAHGRGCDKRAADVISSGWRPLRGLLRCGGCSSGSAHIHPADTRGSPQQPERQPPRPAVQGRARGKHPRLARKLKGQWPPLTLSSRAVLVFLPRIQCQPRKPEYIGERKLFLPKRSLFSCCSHPQEHHTEVCGQQHQSTATISRNPAGAGLATWHMSSPIEENQVLELGRKATQTPPPTTRAATNRRCSRSQYSLLHAC